MFCELWTIMLICSVISIQITNANVPKVPCGNIYCYYANIHPIKGITTTFNVSIQNAKSSGYQDFDIYFTSLGDPCVAPTISFEYERIDNNASNKWIDIWHKNVLIARCGAGAYPNSCNQFSSCLTNFSLNINSIEHNETIKIFVEQSLSINELCTTYHSYAINAILKLTCSDSTAIPTNEPTTDPTIVPTTDPITTTTEAPTQSTVNPTFQPSMPTAQPTQSPTYSKTFCGFKFGDEYQYCYYIDIYPINGISTSWDVSIQNYNDPEDTWFYVYFMPHNTSCNNPSITFVLERIDYEYYDWDWIILWDNNNYFIKRCTGYSRLCNVFATCLWKYNLGINKIAEHDQYRIMLKESEKVSAYCSHGLSINAVLTLTCSGSSAMPTTEPTMQPTWEPTMHPTIAPTNEPTLYPTVYPTPSSSAPTLMPTASPTSPTFNPTLGTISPTSDPTFYPTFNPTIHPTINPTTDPTHLPTFQPTDSTMTPSMTPTVQPTSNPTNAPTVEPTFKPTFIPTIEPTLHPTNSPSVPTMNPTYDPTLEPTNIMLITLSKPTTNEWSVESYDDGNRDNDGKSSEVLGIVLGVIFGLCCCCIFICVGVQMWNAFISSFH